MPLTLEVLFTYIFQMPELSHFQELSSPLEHIFFKVSIAEAFVSCTNNPFQVPCCTCPMVVSLHYIKNITCSLWLGYPDLPYGFCKIENGAFFHSEEPGHAQETYSHLDLNTQMCLLVS